MFALYHNGKQYSLLQLCQPTQQIISKNLLNIQEISGVEYLCLSSYFNIFFCLLVANSNPAKSFANPLLLKVYISGMSEVVTPSIWPTDNKYCGLLMYCWLSFCYFHYTRVHQYSPYKKKKTLLQNDKKNCFIRLTKPKFTKTDTSTLSPSLYSSSVL